MNAFSDTSFLWALYRQQMNSAEARKYYDRMTEPLWASGLLLYEFRQSTRFQIWLNGQDANRGIPAQQGAQALSDLESNLAAGAVVIAPVDWADAHSIAERLSAAYTKTHGYRALDILHVATALHLGAREFLTFDERQSKLAKAAGLRVKP